jgi:predicted nucleic acid-binding protein
VKVALDTNVLAYAEGIDGTEQRDAAIAIIRRLPQDAAICRRKFSASFSTCLCAKAESRAPPPATLS